MQVKRVNLRIVRAKSFMVPPDSSIVDINPDAVRDASMPKED